MSGTDRIPRKEIRVQIKSLGGRKERAGKPRPYRRGLFYPFSPIYEETPD